MVDGVWCEDPITIKAKVYDFFNNSFNEAHIERPSLVNGNFKAITREDKEELECAFHEEVWYAIKQCGSKKSTGARWI